MQDILYDILESAGLDVQESKVYTTLLEQGALTILQLSERSGLKRTNLYNILPSLEKKSLVVQINKGTSAKYFPKSPREIQKLLDIKETNINVAKSIFDIMSTELISKYSLVSHKPVITYLEGLGGLKKLYEDILDTKEDLFLLRSTYDDKREDVDKLVTTQVTAQAKRGIHAKVIGPAEKDAKELYTKYDKIRLVEERFITKFPFNIPAQIIIYGNKTAIATIRQNIIITLIDNSEITQTFRVLFDFIWEYSTAEHEKLVENWKN